MDLTKPLSEKSNLIFEQNISMFQSAELLTSNISKLKLLQTDESFDLFNFTKSKHVTNFLKNNPEIETLDDLLKTFDHYRITYSALDENEIMLLNKILSKFQITDEDISFLINLIGAYFLVNDLRLFQLNPVISILKGLSLKMFSRMKQIQSIIIHNLETDFSPIKIEPGDLELAQSKLDLKGFTNLLKLSPGKKGNMPLNNLVAEMMTIGRKNYPSSNLSEFLIPLLIELKKHFPIKFEGISKLKKEYLLTKELDWKDYLENERLKEEDAQRLATRDIIS